MLQSAAFRGAMVGLWLGVASTVHSSKRLVKIGVWVQTERVHLYPDLVVALRPLQLANMQRRGVPTPAFAKAVLSLDRALQTGEGADAALAEMRRLVGDTAAVEAFIVKTLPLEEETLATRDVQHDSDTPQTSRGPGGVEDQLLRGGSRQSSAAAAAAAAAGIGARSVAGGAPAVPILQADLVVTSGF